MYLIDSNIIIYSYSRENEYLRNWFIDENAHVSCISRIEVLGYHKLTSEEEIYFCDVFDLLSLSQKILDQAIITRKDYNLKLGDCLIAATALVHHLTVITRNVGDFDKVSDLKCVNPLQNSL